MPMLRVLLAVLAMMPLLAHGRRNNLLLMSSDSPSGSSSPHCNSRYLERIMVQSMVGGDVVRSKLRIMRTAKAYTGGAFNVICAQGHFSYIASTRMYCLVELRGVKCFAFLTEAEGHKFTV